MSDPVSPVSSATPEAVHTRWADVPVEAMNPLLSRAFITGAQTMIARIDLKKGCVVPRHSHANEQIAWILEGALVFVLGEEGSEKRMTVRAGEVLVIPSGLPHAAEALEDTDWLNKEDAYLR